MCEAGLEDNYAPSGNLLGRCEPVSKKCDIFNQLFHSLAPALVPYPTNLTREPVKRGFLTLIYFMSLLMEMDRKLQTERTLQV